MTIEQQRVTYRFDPAKVDLSKANCIGVDTDMFMHHSTHHEVKVLCARCEIASDCFFIALMERREGTWGGVWLPNDRSTGGGKRIEAIRNKNADINRHRKVLAARMGMTVEQFTAVHGGTMRNMGVVLRRDIEEEQ
jgi:hypothetical protein